MLLPFLEPNNIEVGCDEAGRGCLAGPVFAAAVILPSKFSNELLDDSKKLSEKDRKTVRIIIEQEAIAWAVASCSAQEIDQHNILNASIFAMHKALSLLNSDFDSILVDGNRFKKYKDKKHHCIVKGDGKYNAIAAASILAKTYRDDYMEKLHLQFPEYQWNKNKAYPTKAHREAIAVHGSCIHHRKSFTLLSKSTQQNLF